MDAKKLTSMEIDAIGEILNISLGASATAISTMLDARVDITTPIVQIKNKQEFEFANMEPAIGVEIAYVDGLSGSNIMLLKKNDVRIIVGMMMGMELTEEEFVLDEMNVSAICEVMNQMMGASATALSELLGRTVNISTPVSSEIEGQKQFKEKYFSDQEYMVVIGFTLRIADKIESEFMNLMPIGLAHELVSGFFSDGVPELEDDTKGAEPDIQQDTAQDTAVQSENETAVPNIPVQEDICGQAEAQIPVDSQPQASMQMQENMQSQMVMQAQVPQTAAVTPGIPDMQMMNSMVQMMELMRQQLEAQNAQMQKIQSAEPKKIKVNAAPRPNLESGPQDVKSQEANLDLIMGVPLDVSVEIGRTKKLVKDILDLNKGSLVVLDKLAGEQVDLFVNGRCIAQGDVVVVDDNFGIRITEILSNEISMEE